MTRILLSGCSGFVGSWLKPKLEENGYEVAGLSRRGEENSKVFGDLTNYKSLVRAVGTVKPEIIINLAAITPNRLCFEYPRLYQETNYMGSVNLVHACLEVLGSDFRFIQASSAEVYGENSWALKREGQRLEPMTPYAVAKAAADKYLSMCGKIYSFDYAMLRCNNTFGRPHSGYFVETMMEKLVKNVVCNLYTPGHMRDYMWIEDHVNAYLTVLKKPFETAFRVFNVSPGEPISNLEMVLLMKRIVDSKSEVKLVPPPENRLFDHTSLVLDSTRIKRLGWKPLTSRRDAILKLRGMYE